MGEVPNMWHQSLLLLFTLALSMVASKHRPIETTTTLIPSTTSTATTSTSAIATTSPSGKVSNDGCWYGGQCKYDYRDRKMRINAPYVGDLAAQMEWCYLKCNTDKECNHFNVHMVRVPQEVQQRTKELHLEHELSQVDPRPQHLEVEVRPQREPVRAAGLRQGDLFSKLQRLVGHKQHPSRGCLQVCQRHLVELVSSPKKRRRLRCASPAKPPATTRCHQRPNKVWVR